MGCDIHGDIEFREHNNDQYWNFARLGSSPRSYAVFGALAGVRNNNYVEPVAPDRGVPIDVAWRTQDHLKEDDGDAHSHSWVTTEEFAEALNRADAEHDEYRAMLAAMRCLPNARFVFWFDN